jgi:hypothetical protein
MQNQPNTAGPAGLGPFNMRIAMLAQPKVVLMAAGLLGLAIDLFVRPLSWVALALIVLATVPWTLQAWSQRPGAIQRGLAPAPAKATAAAEPAVKPGPERRIVPPVQRAGAAATADPVARQTPMLARTTEGEPRSAAPRPAPARAHPVASSETPTAARPVRPEPAR